MLRSLLEVPGAPALIVLTIGSFILAGLTALFLTRIGTVLLYLLAGRRSREIWGAWTLCGPAAALLGAGLGWAIGAVTPHFSGWLLLGAWSLSGLVIGALPWRRPQASQRSARSRIGVRANRLAARHLRTELETFQCLFLGPVAGMLVGAVVGAILAESNALSLPLLAAAGAGIGLFPGLVAGWIGSEHGHVWRLFRGMLAGSFLGGLAAIGAVQLAPTYGTPAVGAVTGAIFCAMMSLVLAERLLTHLRTDDPDRFIIPSSSEPRVDRQVKVLTLSRTSQPRRHRQPQSLSSSAA
jgi:MFS family permease